MREKKDHAFRIFSAAPEDAEGIEEVLYTTWLATYPNADVGITADDIEYLFKDRRSEEILRRRRERIARPPEGRHVLVAKCDDTVVGVCRFLVSSEENEIEVLYVSPPFQGKGIGTSLWKAAHERFAASKPSVVKVASYNGRATRFYETLGFTDTGRRFTVPRFTMKSRAAMPLMEMRRSPDEPAP